MRFPSVHRFATQRRSLAVLTLPILAATLFAVPQLFADEWTKTYTISGQPDLRIDTSDADIRVTTWDQNAIEAKIVTTGYKIGPDGIRIEERQNGDTVELDVRYPHHDLNVGWNHRRVDVIIQMPREGKVDFRTGDGKIDLSNFKGDIRVHTGDGSETLESVDGKLQADTGDGRIKASGRFDELNLKTGDGRLDVHAAAGSTLNAGWTLESGDGSVSLDVPADMGANIDLRTSDGRIDLDVPVTAEGKMHNNEIRGRMNGGGNSLTIRTGDGSIHLGKS